MQNTILFLITPLVSWLVVLVLTPYLRAFALKINFMDKPNHRKVHTQPIPPIGGIIVFLASSLALLFNINMLKELQEIYMMAIGALILLVMGALDDKFDIKAKYKFGIQILIASMVYFSGIKIDSLFGVFGIYHLTDPVSFILTVIVITGAVNAFNLTDGIDGLAAGLALTGLVAYSVIAFINNNTALGIIFLSIIGALTGFLKFNLSKKLKIFMGDAGSLFLGFILVVSGIILIQNTTATSLETQTLSIVIGVLILTILDSLRVYRRRIKRGYSPFRADKTHLHHLMLSFNIKHFTASSIIVAFSIVFILFMFFTSSFLSITLMLISLILLFIIITGLISLNGDVSQWRENIKRIENM